MDILFFSVVVSVAEAVAADFVVNVVIVVIDAVIFVVVVDCVYWKICFRGLLRSFESRLIHFFKFKYH